jgi:hypothetical protein
MTRGYGDDDVEFTARDMESLLRTLAVLATKGAIAWTDGRWVLTAVGHGAVQAADELRKSDTVRTPLPLLCPKVSDRL